MNARGGTKMLRLDFHLFSIPGVAINHSLGFPSWGCVNWPKISKVPFVLKDYNFKFRLTE